MPELAPPTASFEAEEPVTQPDWQELARQRSNGEMNHLPQDFLTHVDRNLEEHGVTRPTTELAENDTMALVEATMAPAVSEATPATETDWQTSFRRAEEELYRISQVADSKTALLSSKLQGILGELRIDDLPDNYTNQLISELIACDKMVFNRLPAETQANWYQSATADVLMNYMSSSTLRRLYKGQTIFIPAGDPNYLQVFLDQPLPAPDLVSKQAGVMARIHLTDGGITELPVGQDERLDKLRRQITKEKAYDLDTRAIIDSIKETKPPDKFYDGRAIEAFNRDCQVAIRTVFRRLGLSDSFSRDILLAAGSRWSEREGRRYYDTATVSQRLEMISYSAKQVGAPTLERLHSEIGLSNPDNYGYTDIKDLIKLLDGDEKFIEKLKATDVTVIFADSLGDYNGALQNELSLHRQPYSQTLMFEIKHPATIYRRLIKLQQLGLQPSTIIMAAHGNPGSVVFGTVPDQRFELVSFKPEPVPKPTPEDTPEDIAKKKQADNKYSLTEARLDRLAAEFMRKHRNGQPPSIILENCSSAVATATAPSASEAVAVRAGQTTDVDVYGAASDMFPIIETQNGNKRISFQASVDPASGMEKPKDTNVTSKIAVRHRLWKSQPTIEHSKVGHIKA